MLDGRKRESAFVEMKLELASSMRLCKSTVPVSYNFINLSLIFHWISDAKTDNTERLVFFADCLEQALASNREIQSNHLFNLQFVLPIDGHGSLDTVHTEISAKCFQFDQSSRILFTIMELLDSVLETVQNKKVLLLSSIKLTSLAHLKICSDLAYCFSWTIQSILIRYDYPCTLTVVQSHNTACQRIRCAQFVRDSGQFERCEWE